MKRIAFVLLGLTILVLPLFAGGGAQGGGTSSQQKMEIKVAFWWEAEGHSFGPDAIGEYIENKFNVDIVPVNMEWSDYEQQLRLWAASDQLPDTFACYPPAQVMFADFVNQGLVKEIPYNLISKYPNLKKVTDEYTVGNQLKDLYGGYYFIRRVYSAGNIVPGRQGGFFYRRDWAEKLGFKDIPTDMETFYNMLRAFVYNDPDGNGIRDTYGVTTGAGFEEFCEAFGAFPNQWINFPNGKVAPGYTDEEPMVQALTWLRRAFDEGLLDPEFPRDHNVIAQKFAQGTFGAMYRQIHYYWIQTHITKQFGGAHPEIKEPLKAVAALGQLAAKPGAKPYRIIEMDASGTCFSANISDAKLEKLLEIDDWLLSKEGKDLCNWGFKDVDYKVNADGTYAKLGTGTLLDKYPSATIRYYADWGFDFNALENPDYTPDERAFGLDFYNRCIQGADNARPIINVLASFSQTEERSLFVMDISAALTEIVTGTSDVRAMYRSFIADANARGLQGVIDSVNKAIKK
jgi:hypothetical protein